MTRGAHRAEEDGARRHLQVGVGGDDDGVIAPQFQDAAAKAARDRLRHVAPHVGGAGEGDQRHAGVVEHHFSNLGAAADQ